MNEPITIPFPSPVLKTTKKGNGTVQEVLLINLAQILVWEPSSTRYSVCVSPIVTPVHTE